MKIKSKLWLIVMTALLVLSCSSLAPVEAQENQAPLSKNLAVSGDYDYPPYEFLDESGMPTGWNVDIFKAVAEVMGLDYALELGPWNQVRTALESGKVDVLIGMYSSEERKRLVAFSSPHLIIHHLIFVRKGSPIKSKQDLRGKAIIVQRGDIMHDYVKENALTQNLILAETPAEALRLLASGKHDCALLGNLQGLYLAHEFRLDNITTVGPPLGSSRYCFAVSLGNTDLLAKLNEGLRILRATERYDVIYDKWFGVIAPPGVPVRVIARYAAITLIPLVLLVAGATFWSWSLKKQVRQRTQELSKELLVREQAEAALHESEAKYRQLFEMESDAIFLIENQTGRIIEVNASALLLYGYTREELLTMKNTDMSAEPERTRAATKEHKLNVPVRYHKRKDGTIFPVEITASHFVFAGKEVHIAAIRDITFRMEAEKRREELEAQLSHAQKMEAIGTLAGGVAHEFNNILGIVLGNAELALYDVPSWNPVKSNLEQIKTASLRAKDVVRQLLTFSRKSEEDRQLINLAPITKECVQFLRASLPMSIELRENTADIGRAVAADPTQIHQLILNLSTNALHSMEGKEGILEFDLQEVAVGEGNCDAAAGLPGGEYVMLKISDNGCGIPPNIMDRIFDPFFTTKDVGKGTGLGLAVVHGIVTNHGGFLQVESEVDKGTTFKVFLPTVAGQSLQDIQKDMELPTGTERILFVDDEQPLAELGKMTLEHLGYHVQVATDPREALSLFQSHPEQFDLVITDMTMPGMTGDQLVKAMQLIRPTVPIILCTGYNEKIDEGKAREIGVREYALKPLSAEHLAVIVRSALFTGA